MSDWISVEDRLPDVDERVIFCTSYNGYMIISSIVEGVSPENDWLALLGISHWHPIPDPPKDTCE